MEDAGEAMAVAWRGAAPAILASGATVIVGLLTLVFAAAIPPPRSARWGPPASPSRCS